MHLCHNHHHIMNYSVTAGAAYLYGLHTSNGMPLLSRAVGGLPQVSTSPQLLSRTSSLFSAFPLEQSQSAALHHTLPFLATSLPTRAFRRTGKVMNAKHHNAPFFQYFIKMPFSIFSNSTDEFSGTRYIIWGICLFRQEGTIATSLH